MNNVQETLLKILGFEHREWEDQNAEGDKVYYFYHPDLCQMDLVGLWFTVVDTEGWEQRLIHQVHDLGFTNGRRHFREEFKTLFQINS